MPTIFIPNYVFLIGLECRFVIYWVLVYVISRLNSHLSVCLFLSQLPVPYCFDYSGFGICLITGKASLLHCLWPSFWGQGVAGIKRLGFFPDVSSSKWAWNSFCQDESGERGEQDLCSHWEGIHLVSHEFGSPWPSHCTGLSWACTCWWSIIQRKRCQIRVSFLVLLPVHGTLPTLMLSAVLSVQAILHILTHTHAPLEGLLCGGALGVLS